jgi:hypothetical protein
MKAFVQISVFSLIFSVFLSPVVQAQNIQQSLERRFDQYKEGVLKERVFVISDRDVYAPDEQIWLAAFVYDALSPRLSELSDKVSITLFSSNFDKLVTQELAIHSGLADGSIVLPGNLNEGLYYLTGSTGHSGKDSYYKKKIVIRNKIVPPFVIEASLPDQYYLAGQQIPLSISFKDYYNESLKNVGYRIDLYDGNKKMRTIEGKIKKGEEVIQNIAIPENIRSGLFHYRISAESRGLAAELRGLLSVVTSQVFVEFFPQNGMLVNGLSSDVSYFVCSADGSPLEVKGSIMAGDGVITDIQSGKDGLGSFSFVPSYGKEYYLKIEQPSISGKTFPLPEIRQKGFALSIRERSTDKIKYLVQNATDGDRAVVLVGVSDGEIFSVSELKVAGEVLVDVDISKAKGALGHFILINEAVDIESEHIAVLREPAPASIDVNVIDGVPTKRSKVEVEINIPLGPGKLVFSAVNATWKAEGLNNQSIGLVSLPYDFTQSEAMQQKQFLTYGMGELDVYAKYYTPCLFGWNNVLNTQGAFQQKTLDKRFYDNVLLSNEITAMGTEVRESGMITNSNLISSSSLPAANPKYVSDLHRIKKENKPSYKNLLENGTPILDVIKTMKSFNMQGNKIVFFGSANSLMNQDGALIAIDGVNRGTDASVLTSLSPFDVEKIYVSTDPNDIQRYTGLNSVGLIEIELKKGGYLKPTDSKNLSPDEKFESPDYEKKKDGGTDDLRSTLFWEVDENVSPGSKYQIKYFNSDFISDVKGCVIFVPESGIPLRSTFEYEIK